MGTGFIGTKQDLLKMAVNEGHPDPKSVKTLGELINWVADKRKNKKWPPIDPGTKVKTTKPNMALRNEWTDEGWAKRKWGVKGVIITHHDSHGLCYDVRHSDGTVGCYDPSELTVV